MSLELYVGESMHGMRHKLYEHVERWKRIYTWAMKCETINGGGGRLRDWSQKDKRKVLKK